MYQIIQTTTLSGQQFCSIKRIFDNAFIPMDEANTDYQQYLKWLSEGNTPTPADEGAE